MNESGRIELGAEDLVGTVSENGYTPVADEGDDLLGLGSFNLRTDMLGVADAVFPLDIDENEIVLAAPKHGDAFGIAEGRVDFKTRESQDLIAKRAYRLTSADVQYRAFAVNRKFHFEPNFL